MTDEWLSFMEMERADIEGKLIQNVMNTDTTNELNRLRDWNLFGNLAAAFKDGSGEYAMPLFQQLHKDSRIMMTFQLVVLTDEKNVFTSECIGRATVIVGAGLLASLQNSHASRASRSRRNDAGRGISNSQVGENGNFSMINSGGEKHFFP